MLTVKELICHQLHSQLDKKIEDAKSSIQSTIEARNNDTKSTAGDKHETGRAMIQIELEKEENQLNNTIALKKELLKISYNKSFSKIEFGSLVITNQGNYFIAIGIGRLTLEKEIYFVVSLSSPIGIALKDKIVGDVVSFQNKNIEIFKII